jgi:predicted ATPase/signal transduction histidine kinase
MPEHAKVTLTGYSPPQEIYRSTSSVVARAVRLADRVPVIFKYAASEYPSLREEAARRNEHAILHELDSPHVIRAYELARSHNRLVLVEEDVPGVTLAAYARDHAVAVDAFLAIARALADGLAAVHAAGFIHKDLSPNNVLVDPATLRVKLIDFDLASRLAREHHDARAPEGIAGTLAYISPEQTSRTNRAVDCRSDLYSLGATLYHLLARRPPFDDTGALELVHAHIARAPRRLRDLDPRIPATIAEMVEKLMAKALEARYQSASGLRHDLDRFAARPAARFTLGERDVPTRFEIPQHMYGRDRELAVLLDGFERVAHGASELLLVGGYAGIGKTALVHEVHKPIVRRRGYFISGKFDQFQRAVPYAALGQAFGRLIETIFTEPPERVAAWRAAVTELAGPNGRMLVDLVPALEQLIGPQPALPALAAPDVQGRFHLLVQGFVRLFARAAHPLVMFLDDLQWADNSSLEILEDLLGATRTPYLYVIAAYRDNEVHTGHPVMLAVEDIAWAGTAVSRVMLAPLTLADAAALVERTLRQPAEPLAALLHARSGGNPFFLIQLLHTLHDRALIRLDPARGAWTWDLAPISELGITSNVVDVMTARLARLPPASTAALRVAACIGGTFDLRTLATACELDYDAAARALLPALREGLIVCGTTDYQAAATADLEVLRAEIDAGRFNVRYRFLHDRVQQAAYLLIPDLARPARHLQLGRLLLRRAPADDEGVFEITGHMNLGRALIDDPDEARALAALNLRAAERAKAAAAHRAAIEHCHVALELLGDHAWRDAYELAFALHGHLADCCYLVGDHAASHHHSTAAIAHGRTNRERAALYATRVQLLLTSSRYADATAAGIEGLALLGFAAPVDADALEAACRRERARVDAALAGHTMDSLVAYPACTEPERAMALELLIHTWCAASFDLRVRFAQLLTYWMVTSSLEHGHAAASALVYALYGVILGTEGDLRRGYELGLLGKRLNERYPNATYEIRVCNILAASLNPYFNHLETNLPYYLTTARVGPQVGDLIYAVWAAVLSCLLRTNMGEPLAEVVAESDKQLQLVRDAGDRNMLNAFEIHREVIACLRDGGEVVGSLDGPSFDEAERLGRYVESKFLVGTMWYGAFKAMAHIVLGQPGQALALCEHVDPLQVHEIGSWTQVNHYFYYSLAILAHHADADPLQRADYDRLLDRNLGKLATWAEHAPVNYAHRRDLVLAERARLADRPLEAADLYDRAIEGAARGRFVHDEALALELAGQFYRARGRARTARLYLTDAYQAYARWGAAAKLRLMAERDRDYLLIAREPGPDAARTSLSYPDRASTNQLLDVVTVVKAIQAISSEIVQDKLFTRVMAILTENAGAERGVLLLERDGHLTIEVEATAGGAQLISAPLAATSELALGVVNLVRATRKSVLIDDAQRDPRFARDLHVVRDQPRSILCLPIVHGGRLHGAVYFENNLASGMFTADRLDVLELLIAQAAIAIENASLYGELEQRVAERTEALRDSLDDLTQAQGGLEAANHALRREIDERQQIELELRLAQKLEAVGRLASGIAHEINTPIQFVQDHVAFVREGTQDLLSAIESYRSLQGLVRSGASAELIATLDELDSGTDLAFLADRMPEALEQALYGLGRVATLVRSMKDFAHADRPDKSPADINRALIATLSIAHNEYKYIADVRTELGELPPVVCHISELNQCFLNLIVNASHAIADAVAGTPERGVIGVTSRIEDGMLVIAISDTGTGIPPQIRDKVFDPFFTTKAIGRGTGQGLAIVRSVIVDKHGGSLSFDTELGRGTTFYIRLPVDGGQVDAGRVDAIAS